MSQRIGIDLGGTKISGVVLDGEGQELARLRTASPREDYAATVAAVADLVAGLETAAGLRPGSATVGVGTPGCWHERLRCMKNCNSIWLNDQPLLPDLQRRLGQRVRIANDADCLALSEAVDGAGAEAQSVFAVILGTGVGGGLVVGGMLVQGSNGLVGEWGHTPLPYFRSPVFSKPIDEPAGKADPAEAHRFQLECRLDDRHCYCGRRNCIETFLSGPGLAAMHEELWQESSAATAVAGAATKAAAASFALYQHMLARSLAQVVNLIDPGVIVLGGGVSNAPGLCPALTALIPGYAFTSVRAGSDVAVLVRPARWGDDSGVRGAARLWAVE